MVFRRFSTYSLILAIVAGCMAIKQIPTLHDTAFDHNRHVTTYAYLDCVKCHTPEGMAAPDFKQYRKETCHDCHVDLKYPIRAISNCDRCHPKAFIQNAVGPDHRLNGIASHATRQRLMGVACESCHEGKWCEDCHLRRDTIIRSAHSTNYISLHAIEAAVDPARCGTCHVQATCESCHLKNRWPR